MNFAQIELYHLRIPFQIPFKHNLATHLAGNNLIVKLTTKEGLIGYGEGVPRDFVTGESITDSYRVLRERLLSFRGEAEVENSDRIWTTIADLIGDSLRAAAPAACCALELAILDCAGKQLHCSLADFLPPARYTPRYSAVLPMTGPNASQNLLNQIRRMAIPHVKLKVGGTEDHVLVAQAREILGAEVDIRVDANGAWSAPEAVARITALLPQAISAVEQPVAKTDFEGLRTVSREIPIPVIADESLCTEEDAMRLTTMGACRMFNIRISKCGGIRTAMQMYDHAHHNGIQSQLGCQVGETGILSAAGRHLAAAFDFKYLEGSYGPFLLEKDIVNETVVFGPGGHADPLPGYGLGISVNDGILQHYTVDQCQIKI